eukprot:Nitzschia sp. Nitz4//scaffold219_size35776//3386//6138//NITZ4_007818-RA/size35776-processed-gene-0.6-mRNA-1//1//CDS//3329542302//3511//frame0
MSTESTVVQAQLDSLDDTDCYASVWNDILAQQRSLVVGDPSSSSGGGTLWGGRGKGGRGLARRTVQPFDIRVDDIRLQYLQGDICLEGAYLKLLHGHTYALVGRNGCGKSTLLQRMHAQKIPGWSPQWTSVYLPPEIPPDYASMSPPQVVLSYHERLSEFARASAETSMEEVQAKLDALDMEQNPEESEILCEELSKLDEVLESMQTSPALEQAVQQALTDLHVDTTVKSCADLSKGMQKRVLLCVALVLGQSTNLLLLDEPTAHLDIRGLLELRTILENTSATVVLVSHDVDFINDVATHVIEMQDQKLWYYSGNYDDYRLLKEQQGMHQLRQAVAMEKKQGQIQATLRHIKEQPAPKRGGAKKKAKAVASQRKKLDRHEQQTKELERAPIATSTLIPSKKGLTAQQRLKLAETMKKVPHKAVQFVIPPVTSTWGEPLVTAVDVGYKFEDDLTSSSPPDSADDQQPEDFRVVRKPGYLFDCVDWALEEGSKSCILGPTASGKSTLLKILARQQAPTEGDVFLASGVRVALVDAAAIEDMTVSQNVCALEYLTQQFPQVPQDDLRGHLTAFGLPASIHASTPIVFFSSGEKFRLVLATTLLSKPPVLMLDDPTLHLDVESVQSLVYGLKEWNGTLLVDRKENGSQSLQPILVIGVVFCVETTRPGTWTRDHKPSDPAYRASVEEAGGAVTSVGDNDMAGSLFGGRSEKIAAPVQEHDAFALLALDGLWDVMESDKAVDLVLWFQSEGNNHDESSTLIVEEALGIGVYE